ncbi:MAG: 2-succinyl-6-hydroxy-2,4-cyclohexadiene-1-carboxylate synthase [Cyanobacteria bacterium P01_A01_bin.135]
MLAPELFQFHYRQRGSGPVILFLHGFMGSDRDFDAVVARLQHRYTCLTLDLPDHGQTQLRVERPYSLETAAASLLDWLAPITAQPCALVGYSMGGRLALYLALSAPERFSHLVLESASPGLKTAAERQARIALDESRAQQIQQNFGGFLQGWYQAPMFRNLAQQPEFKAVMERRRQNDPAKLGRSLRCLGTGQQPSLWPHLHKLTLPTLLLTGQQDSKFCAINAEMAAQMPNARWLSIESYGHTVHLEAPERYAEAIASLR